MGPFWAWSFDRPAPKLPNSSFWTWDHSTNLVLDDPGLQDHGCCNPYLKRPETFIEDYRRLTDLAAGLGVGGIVIWGFLRDAHGGVEAGRRVAAYAASNEVGILPGFGTTWYGGAYYQGDHPYSLRRFLSRTPDARMLDEHGEPRAGPDGEFGACPAHPAYREWLREAVGWMRREFEIGGLNLENGDLLVDHHPLTRAARREWPADDEEAFFFQGLSYRQALEAAGEWLSRANVQYATYTGFRPTESLQQGGGMGRRVPAMFDVLPPEGVCQWTLTGMLRTPPLPPTAYLEEGAPAAVFDNPNWPSGLRPPGARGVGLLHQGSQWGGQRYECIVGQIKEACLRAYRSGLEGVTIQGEVSPRVIPCALNYLAFSHFIHWPEDSLRDFGRKTLGPVLGGEQRGEDYVTVLAHWQAGTLNNDLRRLADPAAQGFPAPVYATRARDVVAQQRLGFWLWIESAIGGPPSRPPSSPLVL
jgi:hypothetical protein